MKDFWKDFKKNLFIFSWKKAFLLLAYFILYAIINAIPYVNILSFFFSWPSILFAKHRLMASFLELIQAYGLVTISLLFLEKRIRTKRKTTS